MHKKILLVCVMLIIVSFFLPWVSVNSGAVGGVSKILTGKNQSTIGTVSGFKVPVLANGPESRFMISVIKIFDPSIKDAARQSYYVWCIPVLAILIYNVSIVFRWRWAHLAFGAVGVLIFAVATFQIATTDLDKLVLNVRIGYGMWITLFGYLGIGVIELSEFFRITAEKKAFEEAQLKKK